MSVVRFRPKAPSSSFESKCGSGSVVEHRLAKARVASSNLVFRSSFLPRPLGRVHFTGTAGYIWCDGEVVTLRPAKPPFVGSNPTRTSKENPVRYGLAGFWFWFDHTFDHTFDFSNKNLFYIIYSPLQLHHSPTTPINKRIRAKALLYRQAGRQAVEKT